MSEEFNNLKLSDPTVSKYMDHLKAYPNANKIERLEDCICALVEINKWLREELLKVSSITPFKVVDQQGNMLVYRAPIDIIPERIKAYE